MSDFDQDESDQQDGFGFPEAILVDEGGDALYFEFEPDQCSLLAFYRIEDAVLSLRFAEDRPAEAKRIFPHEWTSIAREWGPTLIDVLAVYQVTEEGIRFRTVPIVDFLRNAKKQINQDSCGLEGRQT